MNGRESELQRRLRQEIDKIPIIDSHQHLIPPHLLAKRQNLDITYLFAAYVSFDLFSAGMPLADMEELRNPESQMPTEQRWQLIKPWYQKAWNTSFCESIRIAVRDLYGVEDITDDTYELLSRKMAESAGEGWMRQVLDKAGIDIAIQISPAGWMGYPRTRYPNLFLDDYYDHFTRLNRSNVDAISEQSGVGIGSLDDFCEAIDWYFDKFADEATGFKISRAYDRTMQVDNVGREEAAPFYNRFLKGEKISPVENKAAEDFIIRYLIAKSGEYGLPVKVHTGIPRDNGRVTSFVPVIVENPHINFCIFHLSWPYTEEFVQIAKFEQNVWVDFCWAWGMNPVSTRRYLSEMLECIPYSKIHGFGGDVNYIEDAYGQMMIGKREITKVLAEKVEEGRFTEDEAIFLARRILRDNLIEHFSVEEKRELYKKRGRERII